MRIIVGLGNPGRRYRGTRHNLGWEVLDRLAAAHDIDIDEDAGFADVGAGTIGRERVLLVRPQTYMNVSGVAVAQVRGRHRVAHAHLLVVYDDLDLPLGVLRFREQGSAGGHNGLRSVIEELNTTAFPRLRIGIGRPPSGVDPAEHVLERPSASERAHLDAAVEAAAEGARLWVVDGPQAAMRHCNATPTQQI
jgi:PTH1 family peptidyl-tRNA hydrolase